MKRTWRMVWAGVLVLAAGWPASAATSDWEPVAVAVLASAGATDDGARSGQALRELLPLGGYGKDGASWLGLLAGRLADGSWRGVLAEARETAAGVGGVLPAAAPRQSGPVLFGVLLLEQVREDNVALAARQMAALQGLFPEVPALAATVTGLDRLQARLKQRDRVIRDTRRVLNDTQEDYDRLVAQQAPGNFYEKRRLDTLTQVERDRRQTELLRLEQARAAANQKLQAALARCDAKAAAQALAVELASGGSATQGGTAP